MNIANFDDLLCAARSQPEPQRLLFVFAGAALPDDATPEQRRRFEAGEGGTLMPLMSVDKAPEELDTFAALAAESHQFAPEWAMVFVAGLSGRGGHAPTRDESEKSLQQMIEAVKTGAFGAYMPFDRQGNPVLID